MLFIPRQMKQEIAKTFYDKEIHLLNRRTEMDAEGGVKNASYSIKDVFKGNVNFTNCEKIQEDYGLDYKIDITISTDYKELNVDDILTYDKVLYEVKGIYKNDSHWLVLGSKWQA